MHNEESLGKRRRSMDPQISSSDPLVESFPNGMRSKRRYSCPEPSLSRSNSSSPESPNTPTQQKISMMRVIGEINQSSKVHALREEKMQEIQSLVVPQNIKKVRNFWQSNLETSTSQTKRSCSVDSDITGKNKKYKPQLYPKPSFSKQMLSRHHSVPTMPPTSPSPDLASTSDYLSQQQPCSTRAPVPHSLSLHNVSSRDTPGPQVSRAPMLRIEVDESPSAWAQNDPIDMFAAGRLSPVTPVSPRSRRKHPKGDSLKPERTSSGETSSFSDFVENVVENVLGSVFVDVSTSSQISQEFEEDTYLNNLVSTNFRDEDICDEPEDMGSREDNRSVSRDLDSFADGLVSQVLNDYFAEQSSEQAHRLDLQERRRSETRSSADAHSAEHGREMRSAEMRRSPSCSPELLSTRDRYKASRCKPVVPAEMWRIRRQRSFGHDLSDSESDLLYMDLDTNSLEMLSSPGELAHDVITSSDVIPPGDVITYADQLSDEIMEEVFKMLSFQDDDSEEDMSDNDDDDDDDDDDGPGDNDPVASDDNDSDKGESVPDYEDVYEFADEYVTNIISSVMTEVSMTTDSGVEELCEDDINVEVFARYIVEDAIHEALNIVRREQPTSPTYGQLIVRDKTCCCPTSRDVTSRGTVVKSRGAGVTSRGNVVTSRDVLMTSRDRAIMSPETALSKKESPEYGTLIILDDLNKDPLSAGCYEKSKSLTLCRRNSNSLPSLLTPLQMHDTRTKSCSDLTCNTDPVLRNLTELCKSLGVSDSASALHSATALVAQQAGGDVGALFDQQLIDCLKPGSFLNVPKNGLLMKSQYMDMSPSPPSLPPRSSSEAIYENSLDVVIKHAREEQSKKKRKKKENSTKRRVRPGTYSVAKQKSLRRNRRNLRLIRRVSSRKKKVVEYDNETSFPHCIPSSYCNLPSLNQTFFVAENTVPKYLSEISYENMAPKEVLKPNSITSLQRFTSFSLNRDISPFVRAEYEGLRKVEQLEKGPPPPPPPVDKGVVTADGACEKEEEEEDDYDDPDNHQDLPVIMPTNVSVEESRELAELYGDEYDDLHIFNRPLPDPTSPEPAIKAHYYEPSSVQEEGEEDNHFYDDITEYHKAADLDHERNGYESVGHMGAGVEEVYTGLDDYNSETEEEEEEEDRQLEEVDVSDLQVEEVELNDLYGDDYEDLSSSTDPFIRLLNNLSPPSSPCTDPYDTPSRRPSTCNTPSTRGPSTEPCDTPSTRGPSTEPCDTPSTRGPSTEPCDTPQEDVFPASSSSSSSLHLYDNQLPELLDHQYYNLARRSHSISTGSSSLPREQDSFHSAMSAMSHTSIFSSTSSSNRSTGHRTASLPRTMTLTSPTTSHYDTPPKRSQGYENIQTRKYIMSWHGTNEQLPHTTTLSSSQGGLSRDLKTTTSQPILLSQLPPYNLSRRSSTSPFTSISDNNVFSNNDLSSSLSCEEFLDEEGYEVPMSDTPRNAECVEEDEEVASSPEHCYELIGGEDNHHLEQDCSHLYEFISEHTMDSKQIPAPLRTSAELTEDELYEDIEVSTPSYRTDTTHYETQYETLEDPGAVTPETPTNWLVSSPRAETYPAGIGEMSLRSHVTSSENLMTSSDNVVTSSSSENVMSCSSEGSRRFRSSSSSVNMVNGGRASPAKSPLRRISAGKTQLTTEELNKLKRAAFIPPPPPPTLDRATFIPPPPPPPTSKEYSHRPPRITSPRVTSPKSLSRRSSSFVSEASSSGQTDDKDTASSISEESHVSDIEEEVAEISPDRNSLIIGEALWDHLPLSKDHLEFSAGDLIEVLQQNGKWWRGRTDSGSTGWFPADSVRLRISQEADELDLQGGGIAGTRRMTIMQRMSTMSRQQKLNPDWVRQKVIEEIINYEEGYVKNLADVIEGPLKEARLRKDLFNDNQIELLFSNIEELFDFQVKFLDSLKKRLKSIVHKSEIGDTFTEHQDKFVEIYSRYCNNHSSALAEYTILNQHMIYTIFFESCRLLKDMESIPLDGYLLKPVQRICQYQLQLKELLKYTKTTHPDHAKVKEAECIMSTVASTVNERKRRTENINKLAQWQSSIEDWRGEDILVKSSIMIHSGSLYKISAGNKQLRRFFLFDKQLVYCRKLLGSGKLQYKGRINLDQCQTVNLVDNEEPGVVNAWKMENRAKNKWVVLICKKNSDKTTWLDALKEERKQVQQDKENNFVIPEAQKEAAYVQVTRSSSTRSKKLNSFSQKSKSSSDLRNSLLVELNPRDSKSKTNKKLKGFSNKMFLKKQKKVIH